MYYVYALKSKKNSRIYVGMTSDIENRLKEHNSGKTKSTKYYIPWKLVFSEKRSSRKAARILEKKLKSGEEKEFLKSLKN